MSSPIERIKARYEVVVVGSGYGGAIAASRLARAGLRVGVLERGRELRPGDFPDTPGKALAELQINARGSRGASRTGLYDLRVNDDINVIVGCGLGGTSLINANIVLVPDDRVFDDRRWPAALRRDVLTGLTAGFHRAREMLRPVPHPFPSPLKLDALARSVQDLERAGSTPLFWRPPIAVNFVDGRNRVGVLQRACRACGDCVSGCNYGAKNTVLMNYLPDARAHGAEIYTETSVRYVEEDRTGRWVVHFELSGSGSEKFEAPPMFVTADLVILAAGTLGTTEILCRSKSRGTWVSGNLGERFTGNGDVIAFGYNAGRPVNGVGAGSHLPDDREPVGATIAGLIDLRRVPELNAGVVIEEGAIPGAISSFLPAAFAAVALAMGEAPPAGLALRLTGRARRAWRVLQGAHGGAIRNTQTFLVMTHDEASGRMYLDRDDRLRIEWPGVERQQIFQEVSRLLRAANGPLGATFVSNPANLTTVHPLGGCCMAEDGRYGVVNHAGQVFRGLGGADNVYENLYVCDGSMIPRPLGVNPLLTISALAERTCALIARKHNLTIDYRLSR